MVSPFIGRLHDIGQEGMTLVEDIVAIFRRYDVETLVMAACIRHALHCTLAAKVRADISTVPYPVLKQMVQHSMS